MAVLGLILLLAAGGLTLDVVLQNSRSVNVNALGQTFALSPGWVFVAGVVAGAVALLAVTMIAGGLGRSHRRRGALAEARNSAQVLQAERDQLAGDLYHERASRISTADGRVDGQEPPATLEPAVPSPAATVAMSQSDGRVTQTVHRRGILHRRHHDDDRPVVATTADSTAVPEDLG
jgi:hypothetical protein